jgi:hypothetical protein
MRGRLPAKARPWNLRAESRSLDLSLNTDGRRCRPGRAGQEAERQKRDDDLQSIELGNSGFHGSATLSYYLVE